ncbi:MAG: heme o synthase [Candidatus Saccharibacteria bacterium]|nr:heme o synthase [Candidatus Saccharibacteria bacterium]
MLGAYYQLTKPRVMYGNLITTVAGFLFAAQDSIGWSVLFFTTVGTSLVISSACVINNYLDQDIDRKMERTLNRPLITGVVKPKNALIFGIMLLIGGLTILYTRTNLWVTGIGIFGYVTYVWLYGALGKRQSVHGTLIGSISGAVPILAGYIAVTNNFDVTALLLFMALFFWQMPEFYSISIFRKKEYAKAGIPVSAVVRGVESTQKQIVAYTILTILCMVALAFTAKASMTYLIVISLTSAYWLLQTVHGIQSTQSQIWARKNFHLCIRVLLIFSFLIAIDTYLV